MPLSATAALSKDRTTSCRMEHRHFAKIAGIIATLPRDLDGHFCSRAETARHFAAELSCTNPRFDRDRFLRACGVAS